MKSQRFAGNRDIYSQPELSRMEVRNAYDIAFKKIILVDGIIFASSFLLLYIVKRKAI